MVANIPIHASVKQQQGLCGWVVVQNTFEIWGQRSNKAGPESIQKCQCVYGELRFEVAVAQQQRRPYTRGIGRASSSSSSSSSGSGSCHIRISRRNVPVVGVKVVLQAITKSGRRRGSTAVPFRLAEGSWYYKAYMRAP